MYTKNLKYRFGLFAYIAQWVKTNIAESPLDDFPRKFYTGNQILAQTN